MANQLKFGPVSQCGNPETHSIQHIHPDEGEGRDSEHRAQKTAEAIAGLFLIFQGSPITSKIWSQTNVIAFQESIHRLFDQWHITRIIDTEERKDNKQASVRQQAPRLQHPSDPHYRARFTEVGRLSPSKWERKKRKGGHTYLCAQTAAMIKGNDQIPK